MSFGGVLHAETWLIEIEGGTGGTQYLSTFDTLLRYCVPPVPHPTSNGHISACKTPQKFIWAPLESPHSQFSNGARMSVWVALHAELWPLEVEGGTGRTQYTSTFATLYYYLRHITLIRVLIRPLGRVTGVNFGTYVGLFWGS